MNIINTPIKLLFDNNLVATINTFSYETPWASGEVTFLNQDFLQKLAKVTSMLSFDLEMSEFDLADEVEEQLWEKKLTELDISWEDLQLESDNRWSIEPKESTRQKIYAVRFYENGYMDWRL